MKVCFYARQLCKSPSGPCPKDEALRPMFASAPGQAVKKVWACQWAGRRLTIQGYLLHLVEDGKITSKK